MTAILDQLNTLDLAIAEARGRNYKDNEIEVEARFKYIHENGSYPLSASQFYQFKESISKMKITPVYEISTDYVSGKYRKTVSQKEGQDSLEVITWRMKSMIRNIFLDDYGIKLAVNAEVPISNPPKKFTYNFSRTKNRQSYYLYNNSLRLDLTIVQTMSEKSETSTTYEMELELLDLSKTDLFIKNVKDFWRILHNTEEVYSTKDLLKLTINIKKQLGLDSLSRFNRDVLVQARNIKPNDLVYGGIIGNSYTTYSVTHKADGQRKMLIYDESGVWLAMPPYEYNLITKEPNMNLNGTIIDGELVPKDQRLENAPKVRYWYLAFDCLSIQYTTEIQQKPLHDRAQICLQIARNNKSKLLFINAKEHWEVKSPIDFFSRMSEMLVQSEILSYKTDGFMFTPTLINYNSHSNTLEFSERVLTKNPDIVKYKPKKDLTIDFSVKQIMDSKTKKPVYHLYCSKKGSSEPVEFKGTEQIPYTVDMLDHSNPLLMNIPINTVIEFGWDSTKNYLFPVKYRRDKVVGNDIDVAKNIWMDLFDPISTKALSGNDFSYSMFLLKRTIIDLFNPFKGVLVFYVHSGIAKMIESVWGELAVSHELVLIPSDSLELSFTHKNISIEKSYKTSSASVIGVLLSNHKPPHDSSIPIISIGFDPDLVDNHKIDSMKELIQNYPMTPILKNTYIWDTWTLNHEKFMSEEEKDFSRCMRVVIYSSPMKDEIPHYDFPELINDNQGYPTKRIWSIINPDTGQYSLLNTPLTKENTIKGKGFYKMFYFSNTKLIEEEYSKPPQLKSISSILFNLNKMIELKTIELEEIEKEEELEEKEETEEEEEEKEEEPSNDSDDVTIKAMSTNHEHPVTKLSPLADDQVDVINCSWYQVNPVVRIGAIGDNNCFLHSISKGYNPEYQTESSMKNKMSYIKKLRYALAESLSLEDPDDESNRTFYETVGDGELYKLGQSYKSNQGREAIEDFSEQGIYKLLRSSSFLGDEVYALIGQVLGVNIYIVRCTNKDIYKHTEFIYNKRKQISVVIHGDGTHYETLGISTENGIQTCFYEKDPFIEALSKKAQGYKN